MWTLLTAVFQVLQLKKHSTTYYFFMFELSFSHNIFSALCDIREQQAFDQFIDSKGFLEWCYCNLPFMLSGEAHLNAKQHIEWHLEKKKGKRQECTKAKGKKWPLHLICRRDWVASYWQMPSEIILLQQFCLSHLHLLCPHENRQHIFPSFLHSRLQSF